MKGFFITATNTDRGKTVITAALHCWLQKRGFSPLVMKPVQTGFAEGHLAPDLAEFLRLSEAVFEQELLPLQQPFCYPEPCSPHLAAELAELPSADLDSIFAAAQQLSQHSNCLLVEGAGGLMVPLDRAKKILLIDCIQKLELPVILVVQSGLGAINDACLSAEALKSRGLRVAGFLLNDGPSDCGDTLITRDNPQVIAEFSGLPYLGRLRHLKNLGPQSISEAVEKIPELEALLAYL